MTLKQHHEQSITHIVQMVKGYWDAAAEQPLYEREQQLTALLQQIGQVLLTTSVQGEAETAADPDATCACGAVGHYEGRPHGRHLQTLVGAVEVPARVRYHCAACGKRWYPLDAVLQLEPGTQMSRYLHEQGAYLAALVPYELASAILRQLRAISVCPSQIWQAVQTLGQQEEAAQQAAYQQMQEHPEPIPATTEHQYVCGDGVMYCSRDKQPDGTYQWRELKTAAVYDAQAVPVAASHRAAQVLRHQGDATLPHMDQAQTITYVASARSWQDLGEQTQVELWRRGPQRERIALGDGAETIQAFFDTYVRAPGVHVTRILDIRHAEQHLWEVARRVPDAERVAWLDQAIGLLECGKAADLCQSLRETATHWAQQPDDAKVASQAAGYFQRHAAHIDYLDFIDHHYQIASGIAESTCKRFGVDRMKGTGMRWNQNGAHFIAILRARILNGRWPSPAPLSPCA